MSATFAEAMFSPAVQQALHTQVYEALYRAIVRAPSAGPAGQRGRNRAPDADQPGARSRGDPTTRTRRPICERAPARHDCGVARASRCRGDVHATGGPRSAGNCARRRTADRNDLMNLDGCCSQWKPWGSRLTCSALLDADASSIARSSRRPSGPICGTSGRASTPARSPSTSSARSLAGRRGHSGSPSGDSGGTSDGDSGVAPTSCASTYWRSASSSSVSAGLEFDTGRRGSLLMGTHRLAGSPASARFGDPIPLTV